MKLARSSLFWLALVRFCVAVLDAEISEQDLGAFSRPTDKDSESFATKRAKGIVAEIAKTKSFKKWKIFEDDKVRFRYPDHEAISIEVNRNKPVPVDGDRLSNVNTSFSCAYRLTVKGETLLVLMLRKADWLDDGICFCGAVVYDRYLVRNGNLYRFSFLGNGVLKKVQVLGDGERVMMFEWTHLPIHPAVYRQIAQSTELKKKGPWTKTDCRKRVLDRYGSAGVVGWFDEGSTDEKVKGLLGKPSRVEDGGIHVWEYPKMEGGYRWTERLSLPFADGKLIRFGSGYYDSAWNNRKAVKGGLPWMMEVARPYENRAFHGEKAEKMPEQLKKELTALFLKKAAERDDNFESLCQVLQILVAQGVKDERALAVVRKRFISGGGHFAAWVLHEAGQAGDVTLFVDKIRELYREAKGDPERDLESSDLHNWLAFIPDGDKRYPALLREGLKNPNSGVREDAYYFLDSAPFPEEERTAFVRSGLRDASARIRYWSTRYYDKNNMPNRDWELLRKAAEREKDEQTLKEMKEVLEKHQVTPQLNGNKTENGDEN